jgi:hypothetical protein
VNCTPVAATGVGASDLLVIVTVVVTTSPGSITPSGASLSVASTVACVAVKVSFAILLSRMG